MSNKKMNWSNVPFVNEVEEFNSTFGKPNNYEPTIPEKKEWQFVYDFVLEELEEYREACERGDIVEVLDALCDIAYVSLGYIVYRTRDKKVMKALDYFRPNLKQFFTDEELSKKH